MLQKIEKIDSERIRGRDDQKEADNKDSSKQPSAQISQAIKGNRKEISKLEKEQIDAEQHQRCCRCSQYRGRIGKIKNRRINIQRKSGHQINGKGIKNCH